MQPPPKRQLELFDIQHLGDREAMAAEIQEDLLGLARRLPSSLYLGTSSWSFPGWSGLVYNRRYPQAILAKEGLRAYARHPLLKAVCIDRSFYAPLLEEDFQGYARQVPRHFRFVVKAAGECVTPVSRQTGAPNPHYLDSGYAAERLVVPMLEGLGEKAAILLFQFPPLAPGQERAEDFLPRLGQFLKQLPAGLNHFVELRTPSLLNRDYFQLLRDSQAGHCFNVHPSSLRLDRQIELARPGTGPLLVRWMLHPGLTYEEARQRYAPFDRLLDAQPATRNRIAELCRQTLASGHPAFVIANNKAEGSAPLTLFELAHLLAQN